MMRTLLTVFPVVAVLAVACGSSATGTNGMPADAATESGPAHTNTHDCAPACGTGRFCKDPMGPGFCPQGGMDAGICPAGCPGCPALPAPSCTALPAACNGTPSCGCLLALCPGGCGSMVGTCSIDADGDWVIGCLSC